MYKIMICDDDRLYAEYLKSLLQKSQKIKIDLNIDICESAEEIIALLKNDAKYDWLIVDLQLGTEDGYKVAEEYRKVSPEGLLYLCSGVYGPTVNSFYTSPYRFLDKGIGEREIIKYMEDGFECLNKKKEKEYLIGHVRASRYKIVSRDIFFIENGKRGSVLNIDREAYQHSDREDMLVEQKLEELYELLCTDFEYISKRCLVNLRHVKKLEKNVVLLDNNIQLTSSRSFVKEFRRRFVEYIENSSI